MVGDHLYWSSGHQFTPIRVFTNRVKTDLAYAGIEWHWIGMDRQCRDLLEIYPRKTRKKNVLQLDTGLHLLCGKLLGLLGKNHPIPLVEKPAVEHPTNASMNEASSVLLLHGSF